MKSNKKRISRKSKRALQFTIAVWDLGHLDRTAFYSVTTHNKLINLHICMQD